MAASRGMRTRGLSRALTDVHLYDTASPAARATVAVGLRPGSLIKAERLLFQAQSARYIEARNMILQRWSEHQGRYVSLQDCLDMDDDRVVRHAWRFLHEQGYINSGIIEGDPLASSSGDLEAGSGPSDGDFKRWLLDRLRVADLAVTTVKSLQRDAEAHFRCDLRWRRPVISEIAKALTEEGKSIEQLEREYAVPPPADVRRVPGLVVIVGAGPAGLAAAAHLKRNGVGVLVLEARDRVGGRVHTYQGSGFSAPVDLGAALITGTQANTEKGLRPDPSATVARQLGFELHQLADSLNIYDSVTGRMVTQAMDNRVDALRDALMDDARDKVEKLGVKAVEGVSLGEALDSAFAARIKLPAEEDAHTGAPIENTAAAAQADPTRPGPEGQPPDAAPLKVAGPDMSGLPEADMKETGEAHALDTRPSPYHSLAAPPQPAVLPVDDPDSEFLESILTGPAAHSPSEAAHEQSAPAEDSGTLQPPGAAVKPEPEVTAGALPQQQPADVAKLEPGNPAAAGAATAGATEPVQVPTTLSAAERRLLDWHWANLEYGCSARLDQVSLPHWNQDEEWGGFGGPHCVVRGGYSQIMTALAAQAPVRYSTPVRQVLYSASGVTVVTSSGERIRADAAIVTATLGCLKAGDILFDPALPQWKTNAIQALGYGNLNKLVMEFPRVFWDGAADYFGAAIEGGAPGRGRCFMFWNNFRTCGQPILTALQSGASADACEQEGEEALQAAAMQVLRRVCGPDVPQPLRRHMTRWGEEPYSRGSYSFVGLHASARTYDDLAAPVQRRLLFAGEHTCKEHPDTVGGAMLSGVREAVRALRMIKGDDESDTDAAADAVDAPLSSGHKRALDMNGAAGRPGKRAKKAKPARMWSNKRMREDGDGAAGTDGDRGLPRREAAYDADTVMQQMEAQKEAREQGKGVWKAVMLAKHGDVERLGMVMEGCESLEAKQQVLEALLQSLRGQQPGTTLPKVAADTGCLRMLQAWMLDDAQLPEQTLLQSIVQVLGSLPLSWTMLKTLSLHDHMGLIVDTAASADVKAQASAVHAKWQKLEAQGRRQGRSSLLDRISGKPSPASMQLLGKSQASSLFEAAEQAPLEVLAEQQRNSQELDLEGMDPEVAARIREIQEAARRHEEAAAAAAEQANAHQASLLLARESAAAQGADAVVSFKQFYKQQLKAQQEKKASKYSNSHRLRRAQQGSGEAHLASKEHRHTASDARPSPAAAPKPSGDAQVQQQVQEHAAEVLKPQYKSGQISREDYKWVLKKTVEKVMSVPSSSSAAALSDSRKQKIAGLVRAYCDKRRKGAK